MRAFSGIVGLALVLSAPADIRAQDPAPSGEAQAAEPIDRVTLEVHERPLAEVVATIARLTGADIRLGTDGSGTPLAKVEDARVSMAFSDVPYVQALRLVAESAHCLVRRERTVFVIYRPALVTVEFEREPLRKAIAAVAAKSGMNVLVGADVPAGLTVSVRLRNIPGMHAIRAIAQSCGMTLVDEREADVVVIRDPAQLRKFLETRVVRLQYVHAFAIESNGAKRWMVFPSSRGPSFDLIAAIERGLSKGPDGKPAGGVDWDNETRSLVISERSDRLDEIERMLQGIDRPSDADDRLQRRLRIAELRLADAEQALKEARAALAGARKR